MLVGYFGPQGKGGREGRTAPKLPILSPLFLLSWSVSVVALVRAQANSFGDASNGPVNILTAVLFAGADERADEHFGSLNDS